MTDEQKRAVKALKKHLKASPADCDSRLIYADVLTEIGGEKEVKEALVQRLLVLYWRLTMQPPTGDRLPTGIKKPERFFAELGGLLRRTPQAEMEVYAKRWHELMKERQALLDSICIDIQMLSEIVLKEKS